METIATIMAFYDQAMEDDNNNWIRWRKKKTKFSEMKANAFFVGVLLDQQQIADRAWDGGEHFVSTHFDPKRNIWKQISELSKGDINNICRNGFNGKSYALGFPANKFPVWIRRNAEKILKNFDGDVRNVWKTKGDPGKIFENFLAFDGIGEALARMAQMILVRNHGVCGGEASSHALSIKPDRHLRKVLYRVGLAKGKSVRDALDAVEDLKVNKANLDAALFIIGREYCTPKTPKCAECPIAKGCQKRLD